MNDTAFVYTLSDPRTDEIRYVGATVNPKHRYSGHINGHDLSDRYFWVCELKAEGLLPIMDVVDECPKDKVKRREYDWYTKLLNDGCDLLNAPGKINGRDYWGDI